MQRKFNFKNGIVARNRFFKSAMSEQLGDKDHNPLPGLARVYGKWVSGGIGISVTGNIMIDRSALGEPANVVLDEKSDLESFKAWGKEGAADGAHIWPQLNHPGKQTPSFLSKVPVAPSAIPLGRGLEKTFNTPRALEGDEILEIIDKFATSARLAKEAGFSGVQIHGAHGYLVSQFLSPRHNQRKDEWGGSVENRARFVLEVYKAIRKTVGDEFPIGIKLNSADFMKGGFSEEDSMLVVSSLSEAGIDLIEISGGTYESPRMMGHKKTVKDSTRKREAYFLDYAHKVRKLVDTPLVVTGGFRSAMGMREALDSGATDFIGLARPLTLVPDLPNRAMKDIDYECDWKPPTTGFSTLDRMIMLGIVWHEQQIHLLARGLEPNPRLSAWSTVWMTLKSIGGLAFKKRRA